MEAGVFRKRLHTVEQRALGHIHLAAAAVGITQIDPVTRIALVCFENHLEFFNRLFGLSVENQKFTQTLAYAQDIIRIQGRDLSVFSDSETPLTLLLVNLNQFEPGPQRGGKIIGYFLVFYGCFIEASLLLIGVRETKMYVSGAGNQTPELLKLFKDQNVVVLLFRDLHNREVGFNMVRVQFHHPFKGGLGLGEPTKILITLA